MDKIVKNIIEYKNLAGNFCMVRKRIEEKDETVLSIIFLIEQIFFLGETQNLNLKCLMILIDSLIKSFA